MIYNFIVIEWFRVSAYLSNNDHRSFVKKQHVFFIAIRHHSLNMIQPKQLTPECLAISTLKRYPDHPEP